MVHSELTILLVGISATKDGGGLILLVTPCVLYPPFLFITRSFWIRGQMRSHSAQIRKAKKLSSKRKATKCGKMLKEVEISGECAVEAAAETPSPAESSGK